MTHILESLELADLATINRVLRKRGLTAKMVDTTPETVSLRVSFLPPPAVKETPLLDAANASLDASIEATAEATDAVS
ncbi:hypothetical protein [Terriglobus sp. RCC_193]|uniref:hypothetical protein n=1 Tax=Terriglobus sp. RCC_193 TaxID=3239218 RepID=UPI00352690F8